MEMEKINENTIRVVLDDEDLTARGIKFLDLLGNQKEIESFFYERAPVHSVKMIFKFLPCVRITEVGTRTRKDQFLGTMVFF